MVWESIPVMDGRFWKKSKIRDFWGSGPGWMAMESVCVVWRQDMWCGDRICGVECGLGTWYMSSGYRI